VAIMIHADLLVLLSDIDGLYTADPRKHRATLLEQVDDLGALDGLRAGRAGSVVGSGGMASKVESVRVATASGVSVIIANGRRPGVLRDVLAGERVGTYFPHRRRRGASRKMWIAYARTAAGSIVVDA